MPLDDVRPGLWPDCRTETLDWLMLETVPERYLDTIFLELCCRLRREGIPVARATLHLRTDHPEWLGVRLTWRDGMTELDAHRFDYAVLDTEAFTFSPVGAIQSGIDEIRQRLDVVDEGQAHYPIYAKLAAEGLTDYVAWPLRFTLGKRQAVSFSADRAGGFTSQDLVALAQLLPALALVIEVRLKNRITRVLLDTYVGPQAGQMILNGATRRGSGTTVEAAIVVIDLRGFTSLSEILPRDDLLALLNDYFDAISPAIEEHGGEILKFMGDGLLATFPIGTAGAHARALKAIAAMGEGMAQLNRSRSEAGRPSLGYGIGVNVGAVMYGNIGSRSRLDFTVVGPAVNLASRLERLTKTMDVNILFSAAFAQLADGDGVLGRVGTYQIRGLAEAVDVYAFQNEAGG